MHTSNKTILTTEYKTNEPFLDNIRKPLAKFILRYLKKQALFVKH